MLKGGGPDVQPDLARGPKGQEPSLTRASSTPSYPCRPGFQVLKDFTLTLPPGKIVALVGQSGGGKGVLTHPQPPTTPLAATRAGLGAGNPAFMVP